MKKKKKKMMLLTTATFSARFSHRVEALIRYAPHQVVSYFSNCCLVLHSTLHFKQLLQFVDQLLAFSFRLFFLLHNHDEVLLSTYRCM